MNITEVYKMDGETYYCRLNEIPFIANVNDPYCNSEIIDRLLAGDFEGQIGTPEEYAVYQQKLQPKIDPKQKLIYELQRIDESISLRTMREAAIGTQEAILRIQQAEEKAQKIRNELAQLK